MSFDSYMLRNRPDQTVDQLNAMLENLEQMKSSIVLKSKGDNVIMVLGEQPIDPSTGRPYSFGIHTYRKLGDRLIEI